MRRPSHATGAREKSPGKTVARLNTGFPRVDNRPDARSPTLLELSMNLSIRRARPTVAAAMTVCAAMVGLLSAGCTPANTADKIVSGTIQGADGKYVDAL